MSDLVQWAAQHDSHLHRNEAATRLHLIDRLLVDCLGWGLDATRPEDHHDGGFADYVLGSLNLHRNRAGGGPPAPSQEALRVHRGVPGIRESKLIQDSLQTLGELFLQDLVSSEDLAEDFPRCSSTSMRS